MRDGVSLRAGFAAILPLVLLLAPSSGSWARSLDCGVAIGSLDDGHIVFTYDDDHKTLASAIAAGGMYVDNNYKDRQWSVLFDRSNRIVAVSVDKQRLLNPVLLLEIDFGADTVVEHRFGNPGVAQGAPKPWRCVGGE